MEEGMVASRDRFGPTCATLWMLGVDRADEHIECARSPALESAGPTYRNHRQAVIHR